MGGAFPKGPILYLDLSMGAAGDMLTASLIGLLPDPDAFVHELNTIGIPGVRYNLERVSKCGISGLHMRVEINGRAEGDAQEGGAHSHAHAAAHSHGHSHGGHGGSEGVHTQGMHSHSGLSDIFAVIDSLDIPESVRKNARDVYSSIADAEAAVHGCPVTLVHFHEVGAMDAVADVVAVCMLMDRLSPAAVYASAVSVGSGTVRCAHGLLSVPAPATARLLEGIPIQAGCVEGELCTPTGAALVSHFVQSFGSMPSMELQASGFGMGTRDFDVCNCLRTYLGKAFCASSGHASALDCVGGSGKTDTVVELSCNIDDMSAEDIGYAIEAMMDAGAMDAFAVPITMKKSRPAAMLTVICLIGDESRIAGAMFAHTSTLGVRRKECMRYILDRGIRTCRTSLGDVRIKESCGYGVRRVKPEFDDVAALSKELGLSLQETRSRIQREIEGEIEQDGRS